MSKPLDDVNLIEPGQFWIAKIDCDGCPMTERLRKGDHRITQNALLFNISLTASNTSLLLNNATIFPTLRSPPPWLYTVQVPPKLSLSALASVYCEDVRCHDGPICYCDRPDILGGYVVSYEYFAYQHWTDVWTVELDILGGNNGYGAGHYVEFSLPVLSIDMKKTEPEGKLTILRVQLLEQEHRARPELTRWEQVLRFLGFQTEDEEKPGHVFYILPEWEGNVRVGTLKHILLTIWVDYSVDMILIIWAAVLGGLVALYLLVRLGMFIDRESKAAGALQRAAIGEESKHNERGGLLDVDEDNVPSEEP